MKTYLLYDGKYFKVGRTKNIEIRLKNIKSNNPDVILIAYTNSDVEYNIFIKYDEYIYHNEWLNIKDDNIVNNILNEFDIHVNKYTEHDKLKKINVCKKILNQKKGQIKASNNKTNKTNNIIKNAIYELNKNNIKITQRKIADITGLGIATIKRHWNIKIKEELFFNKETEIIRYKNFKDVEIEKVSQEDKKLFISKINELKSLGLEPSESLMYDMNIFSKEKTWYMYSKWRISNPFKEENEK